MLRGNEGSRTYDISPCITDCVVYTIYG